MPIDLCADWVAAIQSQTEATLDLLLPPAATSPPRLHAAMRYAVLGGGKRIRPLLCHATGDMFEVPVQTLSLAACAVELIHGYSLVHDDLPSMDNDVLRRGKPTCHVEYGEATALLAGDALQSLAFRAIADSGLPVAATRLLADAAGSQGMAGGQGMDLDAVGMNISLDALETMHRLKTGALIRASVLLGACGGNVGKEVIGCLDRFAAAVGLLFQITDDILDADASTEQLGKTAGKDAMNNKPTYVTLLGLDPARHRAEELGMLAYESLAVFGPRADRLRALVDYITCRKH